MSATPASTNCPDSPFLVFGFAVADHIPAHIATLVAQPLQHGYHEVESFLFADTTDSQYPLAVEVVVGKVSRRSAQIPDLLRVRDVFVHTQRGAMSGSLSQSERCIGSDTVTTLSQREK